MIHRRRGVGDRRTRLVQLTAKGIEAAQGIGSHLDAYSPLMQRLDAHERRTHYDLLRKIVG